MLTLVYLRFGFWTYNKQQKKLNMADCNLKERECKWCTPWGSRLNKGVLFFQNIIRFHGTRYSWQNYSVHCTAFHETHKCWTALREDLYRISPKSVKQYENYGWKLPWIMYDSHCTSFCEANACSNIFVNKCCTKFGLVKNCYTKSVETNNLYQISWNK